MSFLSMIRLFCLSVNSGMGARGFSPTFHRYKLDEPSHWKKPKNIFVCSMADLFGNWVPGEWINEVFEACDRAPQHRYMFLTKNPKRLCDLANKGLLPEWKDNWWFGSTVTNKESRIFASGISWNQFISFEPLHENLEAGLGSFGGVRWFIIGAETGNRPDKIIPEKAWVDNICEAAELTQAAIFMKDSLIPVVGVENMRREFPWEVDHATSKHR
ncbi:MAG: phage Gp37/Gp68 family protein [Clostridiales bacterium]|nr:phage Gp37/Gp68 family protein [Clostridiales bacterium]